MYVTHILELFTLMFYYYYYHYHIDHYVQLNKLNA